MNSNSFVLSFTPIEVSITDFIESSKDLDLSENNQTQELHSEDYKKLLGTTNLESTPEIGIDEAVTLSSKSYNIEKTIQLN